MVKRKDDPSWNSHGWKKTVAFSALSITVMWSRAYCVVILLQGCANENALKELQVAKDFQRGSNTGNVNRNSRTKPARVLMATSFNRIKIILLNSKWTIHEQYDLWNYDRDWSPVKRTKILNGKQKTLKKNK